MALKLTIIFMCFVVLHSTDAGKIYIGDQSFDELLMDSGTSTAAPEYATIPSSSTNDRNSNVTTEYKGKSLNDGFQENKGCGWVNSPKQENQNRSETDNKVKKLPWQVSIYWVTAHRNGKDLEIHDNCAGTLIHPRVVLTQPKYHDTANLNKFRVRAGDWNLPNNEFVPQYSVVESVAKIETRWFDVNLLFLATSIERSKHVNFACLPTPSLVTDVSTNCLLEADHNYMGVAHQKPTKMLEVSTMDLEDCRRKIRESQFLWTDVKMNSSWICVSNIEGHQNPCEGTDGTPLVCPYKDAPGRYYHAGVMSWYSSCYFGDGYGIFKAVAHARKLIDEKMYEKGYTTLTYTP